MHESGQGSAAQTTYSVRDPNSTSVLDDVPEFTRQRPGGIFVVITGPDRGEQAVLSGEPITVGSAPSCELVLSDRTVSRRHVTASLEQGQVFVRDLSSTNGSYTTARGSKRSPSATGPSSSSARPCSSSCRKRKSSSRRRATKKTSASCSAVTARCGGCLVFYATSHRATPRCSSKVRPGPAKSSSPRRSIATRGVPPARLSSSTAARCRASLSSRRCSATSKGRHRRHR